MTLRRTFRASTLRRTLRDWPLLRYIATAVMNILDSAGASYSVPLSILGSDGTAYTVTNVILDKSGNPYTVI